MSRVLHCALPCALLGLFLLVGTVHAWPMWGNERIDHALAPDLPNRVVLAGTIDACLEEVHARDRPRIVPGLQHIVFEVQHVLLGTAFDVGDHLRFSTRSFEWPTRLVPHEAGARAYLIVDPAHKADLIGPFLEHDGRLVTVLPWSGNDPPSVSTRSAVERVLAAELVSAISAASAPLRVRELVRTATPVVTPAQAEATFTPLLQAEDEWLRHTVVAGLAYASPTPENVERAVEDLRTFIRRTPADATYEDLRPMQGGTVAVCRVNAYGMLFSCYAVLHDRRGVTEVRRLLPLLPLYRVVATELEKAPRLQWHHGVEPLCRIGVAADLPILYDYYTSHSTRKDGALSETLPVRYAVTRRLTELLGVPYVLTRTDAGLAGEPEQKALLAEAYARREARAGAAD